MKVLGIDPGARRIGYGMIEKTRSGIRVLEAGLLPVAARPGGAALIEIKAQMDALLRRAAPDIVAIEKLFFSKNRKTAMQVAEARGVIVLAAEEARRAIREYTPNEVKFSCAGDGRADKRAVAKMVRVSLGAPRFKAIDDVTDALAIALCALARERWRRL